MNGFPDASTRSFNLDDYYSAEEAMQLLGKKRSTFYSEVNAGKIPSFLPDPKQKRGMLFPKDAIQTLARRTRKRKLKNRVHLTFEPSTTADVYVAVKNAERIYGREDCISFERALEWRDGNPDISMSAKHGKQLAGMVTFLPLDGEVIMALLQDSLREKDLPLEAIRQWTDHALSVYVAGIAIVPSGDIQTDRYRGRFLLAHTLKWAIALNAQYDIKNWYGVGVTPEGQSLMEQLGFRTLLTLQEGKRKGYMLNALMNAPSELVQRFIQRMQGEISSN